MSDHFNEGNSNEFIECNAVVGFAHNIGNNVEPYHYYGSVSLGCQFTLILC